MVGRGARSGAQPTCARLSSMRPRRFCRGARSTAVRAARTSRPPGHGCGRVLVRDAGPLCQAVQRVVRLALRPHEAGQRIGCLRARVPVPATRQPGQHDAGRRNNGPAGRRVQVGNVDLHARVVRRGQHPARCRAACARSLASASRRRRADRGRAPHHLRGTKPGCWPASVGAPMEAIVRAVVGVLRPRTRPAVSRCCTAPPSCRRALLPRRSHRLHERAVRRGHERERACVCMCVRPTWPAHVRHAQAARAPCAAPLLRRTPAQRRDAPATHGRGAAAACPARGHGPRCSRKHGTGCGAARARAGARAPDIRRLSRRCGARRGRWRALRVVPDGPGGCH